MKSKRKILIPQPEPKNCSPYSEVINRHKAEIDFIPFFTIKPLNSKEFKEQKIEITDYSAIVFTSRVTIDAFFTVAEELKITMPDETKYFCTSEAIALYLQKYIVYRKRRIFFGIGTIASILETIGTKHSGEKFLLAISDNKKSELTRLFAKSKLDHTSAVLVKSEICNLSKVKIEEYDVVVFYSPSDVKSLTENFPELSQGEIKFATFGKSTLAALKKAKFSADIIAPTPQAPSIARALALHFEEK